jgi:hypothetical protein
MTANDGPAIMALEGPGPVLRPARRVGRAVADYLSKAPATHVLFLIIAVTTLVLRGVDPQTTTRILRHQSTNLVQMAHDAPRVLLLSAFLTTQGRLWWEFVRFTAIFVPVERWLGTYRGVAVFIAGHVGASTATTVAIWIAANHGAAGRDLLTPVDVGISYGLAAAAGVLVYRLPRPLSAIVAVALAATAVSAAIRNDTFTDWGHLTALAIGAGIGPIVRPHPATAAVPPATCEPRRWRRWWSWVATPPSVTRVAPYRAARWAALACFAVAAALLVAVPVAHRNPVSIPPPGDIVTSTVLGRSVACGRSCGTALVAYTGASGRVQAVLDLPGDVLLRNGDHLTVRVDPQSPTRVSLLQPSRRVRVGGFLGSAAVVALCVGLALLVLARRGPGPGRRRRPSGAGLDAVQD